MTEEQGRKEIMYQMTMHVVKKLLEEGTITRDDYLKFDTKMREKYCPAFGGLFSKNDLL